MRASQINGCAYCLDMHTKDARAAGETEQRLYLLDAWRETPFYTERERAALAWTEALTLVAESHVARRGLRGGARAFSEEELVDADHRRHRDQRLEPPRLSLSGRRSDDYRPGIHSRARTAQEA